MMTNRIKLVGALCLSIGLFGLTGCPSSSAKFIGEIYDDAGCQEGCDRCPPLAVCISAPYQPACLSPCSTVADCASGQMCAKLDSSPESFNVCVGGAGGVLTYCSVPATCDRPAMCQDANTLLTPLPNLARICGWAVTHCDSGCDSTTAKCN
jgi:hypothetical protein